MPFYEYACPDCGAFFTRRRSISDRDVETICPECAGHRSGRRISVPMAFRRSSDGELSMIGATGAPCGTCAATSCAGCAVA